MRDSLLSRRSCSIMSCPGREEISVILLYRAWVVVRVILLIAVLSPRSLYAAPSYVVEPCCDLCPLASKPSAYNTPVFKPFTTLVQGKEGWLFRSQTDLRTSIGLEAWEYQELTPLHKALKARGVTLVLVPLPTRGLMHADKVVKKTWAQGELALARKNYKEMLQRLRNIGLIVPHLEKLLGEKGKDFYFQRDTHWTPHGAKRMAHLVADAIRTLPAYKTIPRKKFMTTRVGLLGKNGRLQDVATQLCGFGYTNQYVDQFGTVPIETGTVLRRETPRENRNPPQVVIVGTGNLEASYNFAGFLSENIEVEILNLNAVVSAEGPTNRLINYLAGSLFQNNPPSVLIWEFEPNPDFPRHYFYNRAIPTLQNGCKTKPVLLSREANVPSNKKTDLLFNGGGRMRSLLGKDHQIDLRFANPAVRKIQTDVWYTNGQQDTFVHEYVGADWETDGRFMFALRDKPRFGDLTFMSLDITILTPPEGQFSVKAQLCPRLNKKKP